MFVKVATEKKRTPKQVRDHISETEIRISKLLEELRLEDAKSGCKPK